VHGSIRRAHISQAFGVSEPQASADIQAFLTAHPEAVSYDKSASNISPPMAAIGHSGDDAAQAGAWEAAADAGIEWCVAGLIG